MTPKESKGKKSKAKTALARRRAKEKLGAAMTDDEEEEEEEPELFVIPSTKTTAAVAAHSNANALSTIQELNTGDQEANAYNSDSNDKKSAKKGKKRSKKDSPGVDEEALAATNQQIMSSLQGREASPVTALPLPDSYTSGHERKKFLDKISSLHESVEQHTKSMNQLHAYAAKLKQENDYFQAEQKQLFLENSTSKHVISNLVADRNAAVSELEKVVGLYQTQSRREQESLRSDIHKLIGAKDQLAYENNTLELNNTLGRTAVATSSDHFQQSTEQSAIQPPFTQPVNTQRDNINVSGANNPTKINLNQTAPAALQPSLVSGRALLGGVEEGDSDMEDDQSGRASTTPTSQPSLSATMPVATSISIAKLSNHSPLKVASQTLHASQASDVPNADQPSSDASKNIPPTATTAPTLLKEVSLAAMMEDSAHLEKDTWQRLIAAYSYPKSTNSSVARVEDTRTLLGKISVLWVRLGLRMLRDARSESTEKGMRKALLGLEKCARRSVSASKSQSANTAKSNDSPLSKHSFSQTKSAKTFSVSHNHDSSSDSASTCCSGGHNEYCVAVGVVFGMALAQRILNRYPTSEDKTNLLFLLNKMNHGELPMTELSRDNLRDFIDFNFGINLKWDRFDSICQRIDVEKKGFVSTSSVLRAFQQMTPLVDKALSISQGVFVDLLALTISVQGFTERKQEITSTFLTLIGDNTAASPSFAKFMGKEKESFSASKFALMSGSTAGHSATRPSGAGVTDVKILEEQLFVSDVLFELSRDIVCDMDMSCNIDWKAVNNTKKQVTLEHHPLSVSANLQYRSPVTFLLGHHQEACGAVAKSLQIFEGSEREILHSLCTLFVSFLIFRRACLKHMLGEMKSSQSNSPSTSPSRTIVSAELLDKNTIKGLISEIETSLHSLLQSDDKDQKQDVAGTILTNSDALSIAQHEAAMCELLGIPVPCSCASKAQNTDTAGDVKRNKSASQTCGLVHNQCLVEAAVYRTRSFIVAANEILGQERHVKPLASSQVLRDIQQELHESLWGGGGTSGLQDDVGGSGVKSGNKLFKLKALRNSSGGTAGHSGGQYADNSETAEYRLESPIQVVEEVNTLMHKQRVEQTSRYLELLNSKATRKKKIIQSLVSLWTSTKVAVGHRNNVKSVTMSVESVENMRLYAMPIADILSQTRQVQNVLLGDMQKESSTKNSQLAERIALLRKGLQSGSIVDDDGAITTALREIGALEGSLLRANSDAMKLAAKIIDQLEK
eukprot:gene30942-38242_t